MEISEFLKLISLKKQTIISVVILFLIFAIVITFLQPFKYRTESEMLVVQNYSPESDGYAFSRSNEYLSTVLAKVINTNSFFNAVLNSGFNINRNYFTEDANNQIKNWNKTVAASPINDTGIIDIKVYHEDKYQADQIMRAINATLEAKHTDYHGAGDQITVKVIDQPLTSKIPVKPNIPLNLILGAVAGLVFSFFYVYLFPGKNYNLKIISRPGTMPVALENRPAREPVQERFIAVEHTSRTTAENRPSAETFYHNGNFSPAKEYHSQPMANMTPRQSNPDDVDDIVKHGSMQNIFGQSNLGK